MHILGAKLLDRVGQDHWEEHSTNVLGFIRGHSRFHFPPNFWSTGARKNTKL